MDDEGVLRSRPRLWRSWCGECDGSGGDIVGSAFGQRTKGLKSGNEVEICFQDVGGFGILKITIVELTLT